MFKRSPAMSYYDAKAKVESGEAEGIGMLLDGTEPFGVLDLSTAPAEPAVALTVLSTSINCLDYDVMIFDAPVRVTEALTRLEREDWPMTHLVGIFGGRNWLSVHGEDEDVVVAIIYAAQHREKVLAAFGGLNLN